MTPIEILGLVTIAACFILGSVAWRAGYSAGHKAGLKDQLQTRRYWAQAQPSDNVVDLEIPRNGGR